MVRYPEVVVSAIIRDPCRRVLLVQQSKWGDTYSCFVGGHVQFGEHLQDALRREVREEVGLEISDVQLMNCDDWIVRPPQYHREAHLVFINFICLATETRFRLPKNGEIQSAKWVGLDEARDLVSKETRYMIDRLLAGDAQDVAEHVR